MKKEKMLNEARVDTKGGFSDYELESEDSD